MRGESSRFTLFEMPFTWAEGVSKSEKWLLPKIATHDNGELKSGGLADLHERKSMSKSMRKIGSAATRECEAVFGQALKQVHRRSSGAVTPW